MFDKEFYPTPETVIVTMLEGIDIKDKIFLEPSAGKGNIVDYLQNKGAKQVLTYEKNKDLSIILDLKSKVLGNDFFDCTPEEVSHVNYIVMNPPFSNAVEHILHAWRVAPEGCEIVALCNWQTINNLRFSDYRELESITETYGYNLNLGKCFQESERKTGVEVGLIHLFKPIYSEGFDYDDFYMDEEQEITGGNSIMTYNQIQDIVGRYVGAMKCFSEFEVISNNMIEVLKPVGFGDGFAFSANYRDKIRTRQEFSKELQKHCWKWVFNKMNLEKFVTSGVMRDINRFVEIQTKYPFTVRNVYKMLEIIVGTRESTMNRALTEAVDRFTRHTHENRYNVEGWKTNAGHLLNRRFIIPYIVEYDYGKLRTTYRSHGYVEELSDLIKVICHLLGVDFDQIKRLDQFFRDSDCKRNTWYNWAFFRIKGFKKGTLHLEFTDYKTWEILNRAYAKIKGQVLPENI
jgi:hypothetical protein